MDKLAIGIVVILVLCAIAAYSCLEIVPMDKVGVRSNQFKGGLEERDLKPGLWVVIPGMHKLEIMDPTLQELTFGAGTPEGTMNLRTQDQYTSQIDITIFYRIKPGSAWKVRKNMGVGEKFKQRFRQQAEAAIWDVMGELLTEDLYKSEVREKAANQTVTQLRKELAELDLEVENLLIRKVVFDKKFEDKLIEKQLLGQKKLLSESKTRHLFQQEKTELIKRDTGAKVIAIRADRNKLIRTLTAKADAAIRQIQADAEKKSRKRLTDADRTMRQMLADGNLKIKLAEAKGQKAINEAYQSKGGRLLLSRKMVENFKIGRIEVNTSLMNPFDVEQFLRLVGAGTPATDKKEE